jgi:RNA polymerase sigma factor (sigma-70 family)
LSQQKGDESANEPPGISPGCESRVFVERMCIEREGDLKAFLFGILKNGSLIDDAYQRTVVRAIESSASVRIETIRGWLFQIALNEARQIMRDEKREQARRDRLKEELSVEAAVRPAQDEAWQRVEAGVRHHDLAISIRRSIGRLPVEQQEVIRRRIFDGMAFSEIAEAMQLPLGTVLTWMRRGLQRLRQDSGLKSLSEDL